MAIITAKNLKNIRFKFKDKKIVYCSGSFDLLHLAHMIHLDNCKKQGDILVVNVGSDKDIRRNKSKGKPILNEKIRLRSIDFLKPVDFCFIGPAFKAGGHPMQFLSKIITDLRPDVYAINKDSGHIIPYIRKLTKKHDIKLVILNRNKVPGFGDISTTSIIEKVSRLDVEGDE